MNGMTLIIIGACITLVGIVIGIYSAIYKRFTAKRIESQIMKDYQ